MQLHVWDDAWAADEGWQRAAEQLKRDGLIGAFGISINRWQPQNVLKALATGPGGRGAGGLQRLRPGARRTSSSPPAAPGRRGDRPRALRRGHAHRDPHPRQPLARGRLAQHLLLARQPGRERRPRRGAGAARAAGSTMPDLALRFILACPDVATVIPGMRKTRHVEANLVGQRSRAAAAGPGRGAARAPLGSHRPHSP